MKSSKGSSILINWQVKPRSCQWLFLHPEASHCQPPLCTGPEQPQGWHEPLQPKELMSHVFLESSSIHFPTINPWVNTGTEPTRFSLQFLYPGWGQGYLHAGNEWMLSPSFLLYHILFILYNGLISEITLFSCHMDVWHMDITLASPGFLYQLPS